MCLLLTSPRLQDHSEYRNWNPSNGRVQCFKEIYPLISKFLQVEKSTAPISQNDRLFQLLIKGLLYESCVEYCQARATASQENYSLNDPSILLMQTQLSETDASLLSWLHALPIETFSCPFEEKSLKINLDRFIKPNLEATWADVILTTPMKPKQQFPYNAVPTGRSRNAELMSRSLAPQYDGLSFGLSRSLIFNGVNENGNHTNGSSNGDGTNGAKYSKKSVNTTNDISRSMALFSLSEKPIVETTSPTKTNSNRNIDPSPKASAQSPRTHLNGIKEEEQPQNNISNTIISTARKQQSAGNSIDTLKSSSPLVSPTNVSNNKTKANKIDENVNIPPVKEKNVSPQSSMLENINMHDSALFKVSSNIYK